MPATSSTCFSRPRACWLSELRKGGAIAITGFGNFEVRKRAAREGRNPQTGESIKIKASKVPAFRPGKGLKDLVNKAK